MGVLRRSIGYLDKTQMDKKVLKALKALMKELLRTVDLEERYAEKRYTVPINNCPVSESLKTEIRSCANNYLANLKLKERLQFVLGASATNTDLNFWIINTWGAVKFAKNQVNQDRIVDFYNCLESKKNTDFSAIASKSKVMSFIRPESYFVYDSRVSYSLNWLMLQAGAKDGFFPILPGQSKLAKECDLYHVLKDQHGYCFIKQTEAYGKYCNVIKMLCPKGVKPYLIEMLLFQIAPREIYQAFKKEYLDTKYYIPKEKQDDSNNYAQTSTKKTLKHNPNNKTLKKTHLSQGANIRGRNVLYGYNIPVEGRNYYLFVGEKPSFKYLELLTGKDSERIVDCRLYHEVKTDYLGDKEGKDYIYKRLRPYDEGEAKRLLDVILNRMTNGNKKESD